MRRLFPFTLLVILLCSCILHPRYERPCVDIPDSWILQSNEISTLANVDWWKQFNDPVLDCLITEALENNRDLKIAIARVYQYLAQYRIVRANLFPEIFGTASATREETSLYITPLLPGQKRLTDEYTALFNLSYEVDVWGQIRSATEAALAELLGSVQARRTVVLTLVSNVAAGYVVLRQYDGQLEVAKMTLASRNESLELLKLRFEEGQISELDVMQAKSEVEDASIVLKEILLEQKLQEHLLCVLLGRNPGPIPRGLPLDALIQPNIIPEGLPSDILDQRPDILDAEDQLIAANANIGVARAALFPQITLTGLYGNESLDLSKLFYGPANTWLYGAALTQIIFDAGRTAAAVDLAISQQQQALYAYEQAILTAFKEVEDALVERKINIELVANHKTQVDVLQKSLELSILRYQNGQVDYLNVQDAERNLFNAQLSLVASQSDLFMSIVNIYKAVGGGWVREADAFVTPEPF